VFINAYARSVVMRGVAAARSVYEEFEYAYTSVNGVYDVINARQQPVRGDGPPARLSCRYYDAILLLRLFIALLHMPLFFTMLLLLLDVCLRLFVIFCLLMLMPFMPHLLLFMPLFAPLR